MSRIPQCYSNRARREAALEEACAPQCDTLTIVEE